MSTGTATRFQPNEGQSSGLHVLDPFIVIARRKRLIFWVVACAVAGSIAFALLAPKRYRAETQILPPQQSQSIASAMMGQLGAFSSLAGKDLGLRNPADLYITMLKSRSVADALVQRFALRDVYGQEFQVDARARLAQNTDISASKDGVISISVDDANPRRAADIANAYVDALRNVAQQMAVTEATDRRRFYEEELHSAESDLARAEQEFRSVQEKTGVIQLEGQTRAALESSAALRAQIAAKQVQIKAMSSFATDQNPDLVRSRTELQALEADLGELERKQGSDITSPSLSKMPAAGLEYLRKLRQVKYYEGVYELLSRETESAKIDQAREAYIIQVLDPAEVPEVKHSPNRRLIVLVATFLALFVSVLLAFALELWEQLSSEPDFSRRINVLKQHVWHKSANNRA